MTTVRLRPWRDADAGVVAAMAADPHLVRFSTLPVLGAERWIAEQIAGERGPSRAVCAGAGDQALGKIALRLPGHASPATTCAAIHADDSPVGELSYWIVPGARGQGLSEAAVRAMLPLAAAAGLRTVVLDIALDNHASLRVAARLHAERRTPERVEADQAGVRCSFAVHVLAVPSRGTATGGPEQ